MRDFHFHEIPLRGSQNPHGVPRLSLYLVTRGDRKPSMPLSEFCSQISEVLDGSGLVPLKISPSDIIFALRSSNWHSMERRRRPSSHHPDTDSTK